LALNKIDITRFDQLSQEDQEAIHAIEKEGATIVPMSTLTEEGVSKVKETACDRLLDQRVETLVKTKRVNTFLNKITLTTPTPRDNKQRPPIVPESVTNQDLMVTEKEKLPEELEDEQKPDWMKGLGLVREWKKQYQLKNDEWKFDIVPEIKDGHNISDFIDPEIMEKLDQLEKEEEERENELGDTMDMEEDIDELNEDEKELVEQIRSRKKLIAQKHILERGHTKSTVLSKTDSDRSRTIDNFENKLKGIGIDPTRASERLRSKSRESSRVGRKRTRSASVVEGETTKIQKKKSHSRSRTPAQQGLKDEKQVTKVRKMARGAQKERNKEARKGEGDHHIPDLKPKHLFSGIRSIGKTDRR